MSPAGTRGLRTTLNLTQLPQAVTGCESEAARHRTDRKPLRDTLVLMRSNKHFIKTPIPKAEWAAWTRQVDKQRSACLDPALS